MEKNSKISQGLDYYKATMGMNEFLKHPEAEVTFTLKNRSPNLLSEFVSPVELQDRLNELAEGWRPSEIAYLAGLQNQDGKATFSQEYLDFLISNPLPPVKIGYDKRGDLAVEATGKWPLVTFWETVIMSEINEIYFRNKLAREGYSLEEVYAEGDRRLDEKIKLLKSRPDIKFSDFGTRRRFSYDWQGTYGNELSIALTDTFTTDFFFADFTPEQMTSWKGLRHDSGDPIEFGNKAIEIYKKNGIDPLEKTIVFSDGLDVDEIIRIADYFKDKINVTFGWGTTLTNDLGITPNNFVMKATEVDGVSTVKLSDTPGKHTGSGDKIREYSEFVKAALAEKALNNTLATV